MVPVDLEGSCVRRQRSASGVSEPWSVAAAVYAVLGVEATRLFVVSLGASVTGGSTLDSMTHIK